MNVADDRNAVSCISAKTWTVSYPKPTFAPLAFWFGSSIWIICVLVISVQYKCPNSVFVSRSFECSLRINWTNVYNLWNRFFNSPLLSNIIVFIQTKSSGIWDSRFFPLTNWSFSLTSRDYLLLSLLKARWLQL